MLRIHSLLPGLALLAVTQTPAHAQWTQGFVSIARQDMAPVQAGNLALFAGGRTGSSLFTRVDIYDNTTGNFIIAQDLTVARTDLAGASLGNLAFFAGGSTSLQSSTDRIDIYDALTDTWSMYQLSQARFGLSAITLGDKVIFAGGATGGPATAVASDRVDIYDSTMGLPTDSNAWTQAILSQARGGMGAATAGEHAVFAGGFTGTAATDRVDIYDDSTGMWTVGPNLSTPRAPGKGCVGVGSKGYFAGGQVGQGVPTAIMEIYDATTGTWTLNWLESPRFLLGATAIGNTVLFAGGSSTPGPTLTAVDTVDVFNHGTQTWQPTQNLSIARFALAATAFGDKALFAAGNTGTGGSTLVDIYEPVGVNYCTPIANSTGNASAITASGSDSVTANNLVLSANSLPAGQFGLFYHGDAQAQVPLGNGIRCVGGSVIRILPPAQADASGNLVVALDNSTAGGQGITMGVTRHFQAWYRDPAGGPAGFNFSDGISVTFTQ